MEESHTVLEVVRVASTDMQTAVMGLGAGFKITLARPPIVARFNLPPIGARFNLPPSGARYNLLVLQPLHVAGFGVSLSLVAIQPVV